MLDKVYRKEEKKRVNSNWHGTDSVFFLGPKISDFGQKKAQSEK